MRRVNFAYVAQLDLPGYPVKIGYSANPRRRLASFDCATPLGLDWCGFEKANHAPSLIWPDDRSTKAAA